MTTTEQITPSIQPSAQPITEQISIFYCVECGAVIKQQREGTLYECEHCTNQREE